MYMFVLFVLDFSIRDRDYGLGYMLHTWVPGPLRLMTARPRDAQVPLLLQLNRTFG